MINPTNHRNISTNKRAPTIANYGPELQTACQLQKQEPPLAKPEEGPEDGQSVTGLQQQPGPSTVTGQEAAVGHESATSQGLGQQVGIKI